MHCDPPPVRFRAVPLAHSELCPFTDLYHGLYQTMPVVFHGRLTSLMNVPCYTHLPILHSDDTMARIGLAQALTVNVMGNGDNLHWHFDCNVCTGTHYKPKWRQKYGFEMCFCYRIPAPVVPGPIQNTSPIQIL